MASVRPTKSSPTRLVTRNRRRKVSLRSRNESAGGRRRRTSCVGSSAGLAGRVVVCVPSVTV
jgi:hypothetical protein